MQILQTTQEIFDFISIGIIEQGGPSIEAENRGYSKQLFCKYRSSKGRKCAAGFLIPDEIYDKSFESSILNKLTWFNQNYLNNLKLIELLQYKHDNIAQYESSNDEEFIELWKNEMIYVGKSLNLDVSKLYNI